MNPITYTINDSAMIEVQPDAWDSKILERNCGKVYFSGDLSSISWNLHTESLFKLLKREGYEYLTWRLNQSQSQEIPMKALLFEEIDRVVELNISLKNIDNVNPNLPSPKSNACKKIGEICRDTFTMSRFHNDPILGKKIADKAYFEWGKNACSGQASDVCFVDDENSPQAFISVKKRDGFGSIDLIGVCENVQGKGLGKKLIQQSLHWAKSQGFLKMKVITQTGNAGALALYKKMGFEPETNFSTFRWSAR